jgi:hypothetical protein
MLSPLYGQLSPLRVPTILAPDADALAYIAAVETADGATLEDGVKSAINNFVAGCKSDGIWSAIKAACILAGARTLDGALVPLIGTAPTNNNFVSGDYDRETGILGNGVSKFLDSGRLNNDDPQNDHHQSVYATVAEAFESGGNYMIGASGFGAAGTSSIGRRGVSPGNIFARNRSTTLYDTGQVGSITGLYGTSRSASTSFTGRANGTNSTAAITSQTPAADPVYVFRAGDLNTIAFSNARLSFYSIGESIDLAALDTRVSTLMTDLDAAI